MPNNKSAIKRVKTSEQAAVRNKAEKSGIGTIRNKLYAAISEGDKANSDKLFRSYCSVLDKAAKRGTIKTNNASRRKSRAAARIAAIA